MVKLAVAAAIFAVIIGITACLPASDYNKEVELYDKIDFFEQKAEICDFESDLLDSYNGSIYFNWDVFDFKVHKSMTFQEFQEQRVKRDEEIKERIDRELVILERECTN